MDAHALLTSQGWRGSGHSLKADGSGLVRPILVSQKQNKLGLGKKQHRTSDMWWMNAFDSSLKGLDTSKEGTVVQTVTNSGLDMVAKGGSRFVGSTGLYACFVRGESLSGTITPEETKEEAKDKEEKEKKEGKESKEERRARKAAKRAGKAAKESATTSESTSPEPTDDEKTETKEERRERRRLKKLAKKEKKEKKEKKKEGRSKTDAVESQSSGDEILPDADATSQTPKKTKSKDKSKDKKRKKDDEEKPSKKRRRE